MSQITRCPACSTYFKVVPDQLRVSQGWVRCGRCSQVFDGAAQLCEMPTEEVQSHASSAHDQDGPASVGRPVPSGTDAINLSATIPSPGQLQEAPLDSVLTAPLVDREGGAAIVLGEAASDLPSMAASLKDSLPLAASARTTALEQDRHEIESKPERVDLKSVSFLVASRRKALWNSWGMRLALFALASVLSLALGVQVAIQDKDRLAAEYPALKPGLVRLCEWARCDVVAWQNIDAVVIESSAFNRMKGDVYRFGLGLRNTSSVPVAMPAIELTLTDGQDQSVIRRVLTAEDLGLAPPVLAGGQEWTGSLTFSISSGAAQGGRVAGYRVLAFYP